MFCPAQRRRRRFRALVPAAVAVMSFTHVSHGATFNVSWVGPDSSVYNIAANWSGGVVPTNTLSNQYNVTINKAGGAVVGGNVPATINNLTIGSGNMLVTQQDKELTLVGSASGTCTISNSGTLAVAAAIPWSRLTLNAATTNLTGSGRLWIQNGVIGGTSRLISDHYITGRGTFGNDTLTVVNNGTILAGDPDFDAQNLTLNPGPSPWVNNGTMLSGYNGVLGLYDGTFANSGGLIRANTGTVSIYQSTVNGGTITALSTGTVSISSSTIFVAHLGAAAGGLVRVSNNVSTLNEVFNHGNLAVGGGGTALVTNIIDNSGTIHIGHGAVPGNATLSFGAGSTALSGNGTILLNTGTLGAARVHGTGTLVNGNKLIGAGTITSGMFQNTGLIRATGSGITLTQIGAAPSAGVNAGTMEVQSNARMTLTNGNFSNIGTVNVNGAATLALGGAAASTFYSSGTLNLFAGARLETAAARTLDTTGGAFNLFIASQASASGPLNAGSIALHGTLNQTGPLAAQEIAGVGVLNLTDATTTGSAGHLRIAQVHSTGTMTIAPDGTDAGVSRFTAPPQFTGGGRLDLNDNDLIVDYTTTSLLATIQSQVQTGYADGAWTGAQLTSSAAASNPGFALGYGEASAVFTSFPAQFAGQDIDPSTVLVKYTRSGDANLDGQVNLQDFNRLAANFGTSGSGVWTQGDFNYDGNVNLQDFNKLAANFGLTASGPEVTPTDWARLGVAVPEPAAFALFGAAGAAGMLRRCRRRR